MHNEISKSLRPYITSHLMKSSHDFPITMDKEKSLDVFHHLVHYLKEHHLINHNKTPDLDPNINQAIIAVKSAYGKFFNHVARNIKDHEMKKFYAQSMLDQLINNCESNHIDISTNNSKFNNMIDDLIKHSLPKHNAKHLH